MSLVTPDIGLLFWMMLSFAIVLFFLKKFAWKPILAALHAREESIDSALKASKEAKEEIAKLKASNEDLLREARSERDAMLKEAKEIKDKIITGAENEAKTKADAIVAKALEDIGNEKKAAMAELKGQVASISLEIAEKVLRQKLSDSKEQTALVDSLVKEINLS